MTQIARIIRPRFGPLAMLCGVLWGVHGWIATMNPDFSSPVSTIDYASVASFSAALIALAGCVWYLRVLPTPAVYRGGAAAALGLFTAGVANILEDGFGARLFGVAYVAGVVVGTFALIPMGVGLARGNAPRWIALGPLLSFPGLLFIATQWWGTMILVTTWIAFGAAHSLGRIRLARDGAMLGSARTS